MALADITAVDLMLLGADAIIIAFAAIMYYNQGNSFQKCRQIEISQENLDTWRFFLYGTVISSWLVSYLLFVIPTTVRHFVHLFFVSGVSYMLLISVPAYICKMKGYGGTCNCDFYQYNDFRPMVLIGVLGHIPFIFVEFTTLTGTLYFAVLIIFAKLLDVLLPRKELEPLKYPKELLITEVDELQAFLMTDPHQRKLLTILDAKCDFCEIQVEEILLSNANNGDRIRIFDLTYSDELDPIIPMTLNMNISGKVPVPTTFVFDAGMAVEQKDGVLSRNEIEAILMGY